MRHGNTHRQFPSWVKPRRKTFWRTYEVHIQGFVITALFYWSVLADLKGW